MHLHNAAVPAALILNLPVKRGQRKLAYSAEREEGRRSPLSIILVNSRIDSFCLVY